MSFQALVRYVSVIGGVFVWCCPDVLTKRVVYDNHAWLHTDDGTPATAAACWPLSTVVVGLMTTDAPADGEDIGPHSILMDIQGTEDHYGDMDFKVAGTATGITAIQVFVDLYPSEL